MSYFKNVKVGDEVFGLVFGHGQVVNNWIAGHYSFVVAFDNGYEVPYTEDGIPGWGTFDYQTLFFKKDIDVMSMDFSSNLKNPTPEKIIKWRSKDKLEVKCPSGIWKDASKCSYDYVEDMLQRGFFNKFRKKEK